MEFVRVLYASKATSIHPDIKNDLIEILNSAVDFNSRNEITGVLYYGHGYFVQCLEGRKSKVDDLFYNQILKDQRHQNCEILYYEKCDIGLFKHWNMKFAPVNKRLGDFFIENHRDDFNPFLLSSETIPSFIDLLAGEYDVEPYNFDVNEWSSVFFSKWLKKTHMLIRLCYASSRNQLTSDLLEDLNNILNTAREFNSNNQIFGVLYYANNYFFQCLEGDKAIVQTLFQQIKNDLRHHDIVEFKIMQIDKIYFKNWSMKYVQKCSKIDIFFNQMGYELFTPTALNEDNLDIFLKELLSEKQTRMRKKVGLNQRGVSTFL